MLLSGATPLVVLRGLSGWGRAPLQNRLVLTDARVIYYPMPNLRQLHALAANGFGTAQVELGLCYAEGKGVAQNSVEAVKWFQQAATEAGSPTAQLLLAQCYETGQGVRQNSVMAAKWYLAAAQEGLVEAQYQMGLCHGSGMGVPENLSDAFSWFRAAADQGHAGAQYAMAMCYAHGRGVANKNMSEAAKWYRMAAEQGHSEASAELGILYIQGDGVEQNLEEGIKWGKRAEATKPIQPTASGCFGLMIMFVLAASICVSLTTS